MEHYIRLLAYRVLVVIVCSLSELIKSPSIHISAAAQVQSDKAYSLSCAVSRASGTRSEQKRTRYTTEAKPEAWRHTPLNGPRYQTGR